jgi:hypothetical protein
MAGLAPGVLGVGPGVVGQDAFDGDAVGGEPGGGSSQEGRPGGGGFVGQVFDVGQAGAVVQGGVQVGVSHAVAAVLVRAAGRPAEDLVAAAVGDAAELFDVDVDQFAGPGAFVASHGFTGGPVADDQSGQVVPDEDAVGGGGGDAAAGGQPHWSDAVLTPQPHDLLLDGSRRLARAVVGAAGAVVHPCLAEPPVSVRPACGGGVADPETFRGPPQRPAVVHDTPGQTQPAGRRQRGIEVGHEGLLAVGGRCRNPYRTQKALTRSSTQHACHQRPGTAHLGSFVWISRSLVRVCR